MNYINEHYSTTKYGDKARVLRDRRARELRALGYVLKVGKTGFQDLARCDDFWIKGQGGA